MSRPTIVYVYDALCSWCYGFDAVMAKVETDFRDRADVELVSGGMNIGPRQRRIQEVLGADFRGIYRDVMERSGADIREPYLEGLVTQQNYMLNSERPAVALAAFRSEASRKKQQLAFVTAMQTGMYRDGLDPNSDAYYRSAAAGFGFEGDTFLELMQQPRFLEDAHQDFALAQALGIRGFPHLLVRGSDGKQYYSVSPGYAPFSVIAPKIEQALAADAERVAK